MPKEIFGKLHYNTREAAEEIGVSYFTMKDYRSRGLVHGSKLGRSVWFSVDELREFVQSGGSERKAVHS